MSAVDPSGSCRAEVVQEAEHEAGKGTAVGAAGGARGRGEGEHDLHDDTGRLQLDEQRRLQGEQDSPTGISLINGPWTKAAINLPPHPGRPRRAAGRRRR